VNWAEHRLIKVNNVVSVADWQDYDWLAQGFSLRSAGNVDYRFGEATDARNNIATTIGFNQDNWTAMQQIHGDHIEVVEQEDVGRGARSCESGFADTDAMITQEVGALLTVAVADCIPLLYVDPVKKVVAVAHAGRRGTFAGIAKKMFYHLVEHGSQAQDVQVVIGPSIGPCCYIFNNEPLDLWTLNEDQLKKAGAQTIIRTDLCTKHHSDLFFSHQVDVGSGRFAGFVGLK